MTIHVAGGVYRELCTRPVWNELAGSGGRAAMAIGMMGTPAVLHAYLEDKALADYSALMHFCKVTVEPTKAKSTVGFQYLHDLQRPTVFSRPEAQYETFKVHGEKVLRIGMLEGDAEVHGDMVVYDPQNLGAAKPFTSNNSTAKRLAVVLNESEARAFAGSGTPSNWAAAVADVHSAEVVVIRRGPLSALVWDKGSITLVPAFRTNAAFKIGSGDCFVAHFALGWMEHQLSAVLAVERALRAMAYYSEHKGPPTPELLSAYEAERVVITPDFAAGNPRKVYLAGPFFTTGQLWFVEEVMRNLRAFGLNVFSPFHEVGPGGANDVVQKDLAGVRNSHLVLAISDGFDPGTVYEVGFAKALKMEVVVLKEAESFASAPEQLPEDMKMFEGDGCHICLGLTHAIYTALWEAARWTPPPPPLGPQAR